MRETTIPSVTTIVRIGMFVAIIAILSQIAIPMPFGVPITLQTFALALCGYILGYKYGTLATIVYVLLGSIGIPVFANLSGGISVLFGMTGGFIWGFIVMALLSGLHIKFDSKVIGIMLGLVGLAICHILGVIQFSMVTATGVLKAFTLVSVPYLIKDVVSVVLAYYIAAIVRDRLKAAGLIINA